MTADAEYDLSIEASSDSTAIALSRDGAVVRQLAWDGHQKQSVTLLPNIERLLHEVGTDKRGIAAVFVDIGPGGYAGLRVGVSIAKALAHGFGVPIAGIGRLELDAWRVRRAAADRRIVVARPSGGPDVAWAAYRASGDALSEELAPSMSKLAAVQSALRRDDVLTGEPAALEQLNDVAQAVGAQTLPAEVDPVVALAHAGRLRIDAGRADDPATLVPLYLRGPAIGPPRASS